MNIQDYLKQKTFTCRIDTRPLKLIGQILARILGLIWRQTYLYLKWHAFVSCSSPGKWIEKLHSDSMMSLKVVQLKDTNLQLLQDSHATFTSKNNSVKTFNANTWHAKINLASCQVSVLGDDGVFPWLMNTDSRRIEVNQSWEKKPNPKVQTGMTTIPLVFPKTIMSYRAVLCIITLWWYHANTWSFMWLST